jgi:aminoglycoside phosphotransferase (APT) family kinase protein
MTRTLEVDRARPVRAGQELDAGALADFLAAEVPAFASASTGPLTIEQFGGGYSNLTYLLRGGEGPDAPELVLRKAPLGAPGGVAHDMEREYRILRGLHPVYGRVPRPLAFCGDPAVPGAPFYVMDRVRGVILRGRPDEVAALSEADARGLSETLVDALADIHQVDWHAAGLADLDRGPGYAARQITGWIKRYHAARTDDVPPLERAIAWLEARVAAGGASDHGPALVHNDFKFDNLVLDPADPSRILAVLDWEMATIGDPLLDLGTTLGYWVQADDPEELRRLIPPTMSIHPGSLRRADVVARYGARTGIPIPDPVLLYVYGLVKVAGICQQIYARHLAGKAPDPRFAALGHVVRGLGNAAAAAIDRDSV